MNEIFQKAFLWLRQLPIGLRIVVYLAITVVSLIFTSYPIVSCGVTSTQVIQMDSDSSKIEMGVTPNNSTSTTVNTHLNPK